MGYGLDVARQKPMGMLVNALSPTLRKGAVATGRRTSIIVIKRPIAPDRAAKPRYLRLTKGTGPPASP